MELLRIQHAAEDPGKFIVKKIINCFNSVCLFYTVN